MGEFHGRNIITKWFEWRWKIPQYAPKGDYRVIIGLWSDSDEDGDNNLPIQFSERTFHVMDSNDSNYQPKGTGLRLNT